MGSFIQHTIVPPFFLNIRGSYCNTQTNCQMSPLYDWFERYRVSWYYRHQVGKYLFPQKCCIVIFRCFTIELWLISFFSQSFFWIRYRILLIDWYYEIELYVFSPSPMRKDLELYNIVPYLYIYWIKRNEWRKNPIPLPFITFYDMSVAGSFHQIR